MQKLPQHKSKEFDRTFPAQPFASGVRSSFFYQFIVFSWARKALPSPHIGGVEERRRANELHYEHDRLTFVFPFLCAKTNDPERCRKKRLFLLQSPSARKYRRGFIVVLVHAEVLLHVCPTLCSSSSWDSSCKCSQKSTIHTSKKAILYSLHFSEAFG